MRPPPRTHEALDARGTSSAEAALIVALVAVGALGAWSALGDSVSEKVRCAADALSSSSPSSSSGTRTGCTTAEPRDARAAADVGAAPVPAEDRERALFDRLIARGTPAPARRRLEDALALLPRSALEALAAQGTRIVAAGDSVAEIDASLARARPRGWPRDASFEEVSGAYLPARNVAVVALDAAGDELAHELAHELGHALDLPRGLSDDDDFRAAYAAARFDREGYFGQRGGAGREEALAESFARWVTDPSGLRARAPSLFAYWEAHASAGTRFRAADEDRLRAAGDTARPFGVLGWDPVDSAKRAWKATSEARDFVRDVAVTEQRAVNDPVFKARFALGAAEGVARFGIGTVVGLYEVARHPVRTARAIASAVASPVETLEHVGSALFDFGASWMHAVRGGDARRMGVLAGETGAAVVATIGTGGGAGVARGTGLVGRICAKNGCARALAPRPQLRAQRTRGGRSYCFTAGTLVTLGDGSALPIERIRLGARVRTLADAAASVDRPSSARLGSQWRRVSLALGDVEVELLRPRAWVDALGAGPGDRVAFTLTHMGIEGEARVVAIEDAPDPDPGEGRVVLARIVSESRSVLELRFAESADTLEPTASHPLFSLDRDGWVRAGELRSGERLRTASGFVTIASIASRPGVHRVYNLEVDVDHDFLVSPLEIVSHNDTPCAAAAEDAPRTRSRRSVAPVAAPTPRVEKLLRTLHPEASEYERAVELWTRPVRAFGDSANAVGVSWELEHGILEAIFRRYRPEEVSDRKWRSWSFEERRRYRDEAHWGWSGWTSRSRPERLDADVAGVLDVYRPADISERSWSAMSRNERLEDAFEQVSVDRSLFVGWVRRRSARSFYEEELERIGSVSFETKASGPVTTLAEAFDHALSARESLGPGSFHWHVSFVPERAHADEISDMLVALNDESTLRNIAESPTRVRSEEHGPISSSEALGVQQSLAKDAWATEKKRRSVGLRTYADGRMGFELRWLNGDVERAARRMEAIVRFLDDPGATVRLGSRSRGFEAGDLRGLDRVDKSVSARFSAPAARLLAEQVYNDLPFLYPRVRWSEHTYIPARARARIERESDAYERELERIGRRHGGDTARAGATVAMEKALHRWARRSRIADYL